VHSCPLYPTGTSFSLEGHTRYAIVIGCYCRAALEPRFCAVRATGTGPRGLSASRGDNTDPHRLLPDQLTIYLFLSDFFGNRALVMNRNYTSPSQDHLPHQQQQDRGIKRSYPTSSTSSSPTAAAAAVAGGGASIGIFSRAAVSYPRKRAIAACQVCRG